MRSLIATFLSSAVLATVAVAQAPAAEYNSTVVDAVRGEVDLSTRNGWCDSQYDICNTLCDNEIEENDCSGNDLTWECNCASNGTAPGLQFYLSTMPTNICERALGICRATTATGPNPAEAQDNCEATYVCGSLNIANFAPAASSSVASSSATASATGSPTSPAPTASSSAAAAANVATVEFGLGAVGTALLAAVNALF